MSAAMEEPKPYMTVHTVRSPTAVPYFTLRIADQAAPVPPLPSVAGSTTSSRSPTLSGRKDREHKKNNNNYYYYTSFPAPPHPSFGNTSPPHTSPYSLESNMWKPRDTSLQHRWRFIRPEEFGLIHPPREVMSPVRPVGKSDASPVQRAAEKCTPPTAWPHRRKLQRCLQSSRVSLRDADAPLPQLQYMRLKTWGVRRGWLEEVLRDEDGMCAEGKDRAGDQLLPIRAGKAKSLSPPQSPFPGGKKTTPSGSSSTSGAGVGVKEENAWGKLERDASHVVGAETGEERVATAGTASRLQSSSVRVGTGEGTSVLPTPTITDAAQRLRVTLLTSAFEKLVNDIAETNNYNADERGPLFRHARVFRELPLQSRYHEMHPLCDLRLASQDFRPVKEPRINTMCEVSNTISMSKWANPGSVVMSPHLERSMATTPVVSMATLQFVDNVETRN